MNNAMPDYQSVARTVLRETFGYAAFRNALDHRWDYFAADLAIAVYVAAIMSLALWRIRRPTGHP